MSAQLTVWTKQKGSSLQQPKQAKISFCCFDSLDLLPLQTYLVENQNVLLEESHRHRWENKKWRCDKTFHFQLHYVPVTVLTTALCCYYFHFTWLITCGGCSKKTKKKTHTQKPKLQAAEAPSWRRREKHITLYMLTSKGDTKEEGNKELEWSQATKTGSTKPLFCLCLEIILDLWRCHLEGESTSFTNKSLPTGVGEPYSILKTCFDVRCSTTKVCIIW